MALLAEELVQEWLNRHGYFTIRGAKVGSAEFDLLAVRPSSTGMECRHLEVHASISPIGYVTGKGAKTRDLDEMRAAVSGWVEKKFDRLDTSGLGRRLAPGPWSRELVVHNVKYPNEIELLIEAGVKVHYLRDVVAELRQGGLLLDKTVGEHLVDLVLLVGGGDA